MKLPSVIALSVFLVACAADPAKVADVAAAEAERLAPPSRPLSSFANFELAPMVYSDEIKAEEGKMAEAREFENAYQAKLKPLLAEWNSGIREGASSTLVIESRLTGLKIVSGGARFWAGAFAGDSFIDMDLRLVDKDSGGPVAVVRVYRDADSMTGAWSIGKSDQNLDAYIVSIVESYLKDSY